MLWYLLTLFLLTGTIQALNVSLRLAPDSFAGRIEIQYNGIWRTVCDRSVDISTGHVICRQLGYFEAVAVPCCNAFGTETGVSWLPGVRCRGYESNLTECDHHEWKTKYCLKNGLASLVCRSQNTSISTEMPLRLSYTPVPYAGCVEVKYAEVWGDIGSFGWDQADSRVVCKELGYRDVLTVFWRCRAILKNTYRAITWVDNVRCHGNETSLSNCSRELQTYRSSLGFDAGVVCKRETEPDLNISLAGAPVVFAGRVQVVLGGELGAIDRNTWDLRDAHVVCRQLGYPAAELALRGATYIFGPMGTSQGMKIQWIEDVKCLGNESMLDQCPHKISFTPGPSLEAGVICKSANLERKIRLAGSNFPFAGRLEVSIAGVWGTVRNNGWNTTSSDVVCRQLGYLGVNATIYSSFEQFGKGQGPVWMSGVDCRGQEERLWECPWSKIAGIYWDHDNDIGLICESENENENVGFGEKVPDWKRYLIITLPVLAAVTLVIVLVVLYFRFWHKNRDGDYTGGDSLHMSAVSPSTDIGTLNPVFKNGGSMLQLEKKNREELDWCEIPRESIHLGEKIGSELNVVTFRGRLLLENGSFTTCVVKTCKDLPADRIVSTEIEKHLLSELKVMTFLGSHLNILNMFGACTVKGPTYLVFEFAEHGSLLDYLQQSKVKCDNGYLPAERMSSDLQKLKIALDIARGMKHVAEKKCIHKDLAARNVRISKNLVAKVTNIGSVCDDESSSAESMWKSKWMSPETLETSSFTTHGDVWSFGILLWEIETGGSIPYSEIATEDLLQSLKSGNRLTKPAKCSDAVYDVMRKCWQTVPSERPSFSELYMALDVLVTRLMSSQERD